MRIFWVPLLHKGWQVSFSFSPRICQKLEIWHQSRETYRSWFGQPIVHFLKYQKTRRKIGLKTSDHVLFYAVACFRSYFALCFPIFQQMENMWPHEILRGRVLSYADASLGFCKMILQNNFEPQKRGCMFSLVHEIYIFQIAWIQTKI